jgi:glycosyltransferase involved in cell wall biosynthesis
MAGHWAELGHNVTLVTVFDKPKDFYRLDPRIRRIALTQRPLLESHQSNRLWRAIVRLRFAAKIRQVLWLKRLRAGRIQRNFWLDGLRAAADARRDIWIDRLRTNAKIRGPLWFILSGFALLPIVLLWCALALSIRAARLAVGVVEAAKKAIRLAKLSVRHLIGRVLGRLLSVRATHPVVRSSYGYLCKVLLHATNWRVRALRRVLCGIRPDVVISLLGSTNIMTVSASHGLRHRLVISERNDPRRQRLKSPWEELRPLLYRQADAVTANSSAALDSLRLYCPREKLFYIPNPLVFNETLADSRRTDSILFLGRLVHQKGPDVLVEAFAKFIQRAPQWDLQIAGDGPMTRELEARIREIGLESKVIFHGVVDDPTPLLAQCKLFALPSRFEGTPNALLEAMAYRMPCIISDASPGPLQLITHGVSGWVVPVECAESLADAMLHLAENDELRLQLGKAAFERVREFGLDTVAGVWHNVLFSDSTHLQGARSKTPNQLRYQS